MSLSGSGPAAGRVRFERRGRPRGAGVLAAGVLVSMIAGPGPVGAAEPPQLQVKIDAPQLVGGMRFDAAAGRVTVTLDVGGEGTVDHTWVVPDDFPWGGGWWDAGTFELWAPFQGPDAVTMAPGDVVTATAGTTSRQHTIIDLELTAIDEPTATVTGTAPPGSDIGVFANAYEDAGGTPVRWPRVDGSGNWKAVFSDPPDTGSGEYGQIASFQAGDAIGVLAFDEDGDNTGLDHGDHLPDGAARLAGPGRFETAIGISNDSYPEPGSADAVVLARADVFADALAGTPLAVDRNAPLLITPSDQLLDAIADEIDRVLGRDSARSVYLLGGSAALQPAVEDAVRALGYRVRRLQGPDRFATAVVIADELGSVPAALITTGLDFPDALAAGPAAAVARGAILLSAGDEPTGATDGWLAAHPAVDLHAVGGPAARAYPNATPLVGTSRIQTAVAVAERFFDQPPAVGIARSDQFPDAMTGGAHIAALTHLARAAGPMLLTPSTDLHDDVAAYLCLRTDTVRSVFIYGGELAITPDVAQDATDRANGTGC